MLKKKLLRTALRYAWNEYFLRLQEYLKSVKNTKQRDCSYPEQPRFV